METNGRFLKIVSIITIVLNALLLVLGTLFFLVIALGKAQDLDSLPPGTIPAIVMMLVAAALGLIAGVLGVANCRKPERMNICIIFGILVVIISIVSDVVSFRTDARSLGSVIMSSVTSLLFPVLYIIGCYKVKYSGK